MGKGRGREEGGEGKRREWEKKAGEREKGNSHLFIRGTERESTGWRRRERSACLQQA